MNSINLIGIGCVASASIGENILVTEDQRFQKKNAKATNNGGNLSESQRIER